MQPSTVLFLKSKLDIKKLNRRIFYINSIERKEKKYSAKIISFTPALAFAEF